MVLAYFVTRNDLALLIWASVGKALLCAEPMLFATYGESQCEQFLVLARTVCHDGKDRLFDPEFGYYGDEAATVMHRLLCDFDIWNVKRIPLPFFGRVALYLFATTFHILSHSIAALGLVPF